jgi:hypothetical protein
MRRFGMLLGNLVAASTTVSGAAQLALGSELPLLEAKTLSGDRATLPRDAQGHPMILVLSFSKGAAKVTRPWLEACRAPAASGAPAMPVVRCFDVRMLEGVPGFMRGMVERSMRKGLPEELQRDALLVYVDNDAWRERVGGTEEKTAYVIGCDGEGRVRAAARGEFTATELKKVLDAIATKSPAGSQDPRP